jgi:two-component SAPR family response regulator
MNPVGLISPVPNSSHTIEIQLRMQWSSLIRWRLYALRRILEATRADPMAVVLIVEDDAFVRDIAEAMIQESSHTTLSAGGVGEALAILRDRAPVDVLFTDIRLQDAIHGGCELAHRARELRPEIGVVYATGFYERQFDSLRLPGAPLLLKPYSQEQLSRALTDVLDGRTSAAN